jgi:hypothetical protein
MILRFSIVEKMRRLLRALIAARRIDDTLYTYIFLKLRNKAEIAADAPRPVGKPDCST